MRFLAISMILPKNVVRLYWQLDYGSKLTIVSLLCLTTTLYTIYYLNDGWGHRLFSTGQILYIWQLLSRRLHILCVMFKIIAFFMIMLFVDYMWGLVFLFVDYMWRLVFHSHVAMTWPHHSIKRYRIWSLTPLSKIFQLYRCGFISGGNGSTRGKPPTCRKSLTNFIT